MSSVAQPLIQDPGSPFVAYSQAVADNTALRITLTKRSTSGTETHISWQEVIDLWQHDADFRAMTTTILAQAPYSAFFWETPPITMATLQQPWECVIANAPSLTNVTAESTALCPVPAGQ